MNKIIKKIILILLITAAVSVVSIYAYRIVSNQNIESKQSAESEIDALTFYHWWTSPGESAAINALIDVFIKKYPDTAVMPTPVTGGGGFSMLGIIKPLVNAGEAPDAFQMHAAYESKPYYDAGLLKQIDDIWESEDLESVIPKIVQDMNKFEGHYYSVPIDIHRSNLVWYNKLLLSQNNINPDNLTTWDLFFNACETLKASGVEYPIQMGESWTASHVFEQIVASMGIDFYEDWVNGKITSLDNPKLLEALRIFNKYLSYVNSDYSELSWNSATARVIEGESAFNIMGDWANGEFKAAKKIYGVDYGVFAVPGTENMYGLVIDTFQHPKGIKHPVNAQRWLKNAASKEGQDAFNPLKGSISARTDSDISKYDAYQQFATSDFLAVRYMFPSVVHGSGAPESFKLNLNDIIVQFLDNRDDEEFISSMTRYIQSISSEYTINWSLN
ncbi:carbohydrate ABC transporter substrate-binding protein [Candidatus Peregrinibacteria bacterium]|nr:carbohydrate ABC transporter substrate-binding protein [Candidatus Peregrinibacteria bacterium]